MGLTQELGNLSQFVDLVEESMTKGESWKTSQQSFSENWTYDFQSAVKERIQHFRHLDALMKEYSDLIDSIGLRLNSLKKAKTLSAKRHNKHDGKVS